MSGRFSKKYVFFASKCEGRFKFAIVHVYYCVIFVKFVTFYLSVFQDSLKNWRNAEYFREDSGRIGYFMSGDCVFITRIGHPGVIDQIRSYSTSKTKHFDPCSYIVRFTYKICILMAKKKVYNIIWRVVYTK